MLTLILKTTHILSALLFLGVGIGSAWYKWRADRSGNIEVIAWVQHEIVRADLYFTTPTAILLPATGIALVQLYGLPLTTPWIIAAIIAFVLTGALWLPAVWLQVQMRTLADSALAEGTELSPTFHRYHRYWVALGVPAFALAMFVVWIMVAKRI